MAVATAGRLKQCKQRVQAAAREAFGELSAREIAIFNAGVKVGYRRAYFGRRYRQRKMGQAA